MVPEKEGGSVKNTRSTDSYHVPVHVPRWLDFLYIPTPPYESIGREFINKSRNVDLETLENSWLRFILDKRLLVMFSFVLFALCALVSICLVGISDASRKHDPQNSYIRFSTVTGFFLQDEVSTNASTFSFINTNFGLINRTYPTDTSYDPRGKKTQWQRFANQVFRLNRDSPHGTQYKLLYMGRHGEGYHNAAESFYGTPAWNCYYSLLDGNDTVTWADARLTPEGVTQAQIANAFWASEIRNQKIPTPRNYYTSPLTRCLATANITFSGLDLPGRHPFVPTVKELFREGISGHTCDRRGSKSYIQSAFPSYKIEPGFTETDQLWEAYQAETPVDQDIRSKVVLDDVFSNDRETYISITSHSGEIASLLRGEPSTILMPFCMLIILGAKSWVIELSAYPQGPLYLCS
ncbi:MAG: hypothetical protein Q9216_006589 [Gyalolechia sp. 2 TL-2023]